MPINDDIHNNSIDCVKFRDILLRKFLLRTKRVRRRVSTFSMSGLRQLIGFPVLGQLCCFCQGEES